MAQRVFEPLAGARRNENGTLVHRITDKDIAINLNESRLRAEFDRLKDAEPLDNSDPDSEELRIALM